MGLGPSLQVAVAGAGFAGLAAAVLLARDGHRVVVFDRFEKPDSAGAGILLQPSGLAALRILGIEEQVLQNGARITHLDGVARGRWPVVKLRYDDWRKGAFGLGLHRGMLFDALWTAAADAGVRAVIGREVRDLAALQGRHDLVVIADGCRSSLRVQTGLASTDRVYPWGAMWAILRDPDEKYGSTLWQWYHGAKQMLGIMPTGLSPRGQPVVSLFWSLRADKLDAFREAGLDGFKRQVLALNPQCGPLMDQLTSLDELTWARYHDVTMPRYHTDRAVVIGDAAHATSPQLGQGTNLALLDAVVLADCLRHGPSLAQSLERYTATRSAHLQFYGQASRWLTPLFQSDDWLLPLARTALMNLGCRLPFVGHLTRDTLVGVRQQWLSREPLALPGTAAAQAAAVKSFAGAGSAAGRGAEAC